MSDYRKLKSKLLRLGLTDNQAGIYMLLLQHGELRISQLAKLANLPRTSIYEHLKTLEKLGLIERLIGENFVRIKAYSLDNLRQLLAQRKEELNDLAYELDDVERMVDSIRAVNKKQPATVRYYSGQPGARQLLWNTLKTRSTVYVYSSWGRGRYVGIKFYQNFVSESKNRNVREKVLINPSESTLKSISEHLGSSIARTKLEDIRVLSTDTVLIKGETFIYDDIYAQAYLKDDHIHGFEIESEQFTATQKSIFMTLWKSANPVKSYLRGGTKESLKL